MKAVSAGMESHIAGGRTTLAEGFKVTRRDGYVLACTSHDVSDTVDGVTYNAFPGLDVSEIVSAVGTAVGTLELTTLNDGTIFSTSEIFNGLWRNAEFELFRYNWENVADGKLPLMSGRFGESTLRDGVIVIELRDLRQYLQHKVGSASSQTCRYRLGDSRCRIDLDSSDGPFTVIGTLTGVTSNRVFRDSGRVEAADWFGEGSIEFTTGNNQGVPFKVRSYAADGTFTLALPVFSAVQVGDEYIAIVGCRKRFEEDCVDKFSALVANQFHNFGGEPHRKGFGGVVELP